MENEEGKKTEVVEPEGGEPVEGAPAAGSKSAEDTAPDVAKLQEDLAKARKALKEANAESAGRRKRLDELEAADKSRREAEMTDLQKAQTRIQELESQIQEQESKIKQAARRELQREVAKEISLPEAFASRIAGDTKEEMLADATTMLEALPKVEKTEEGKPPAKPATRVTVTNPAGGQKGETAEQRKQRLGIGTAGSMFDLERAKAHGGGVFIAEPKDK